MRTAIGGGLIPAVRHALDIGVLVEHREGVVQPDHVDVGEEDGAADGQEVDEDLEFEARAVHARGIE